MHFLQFYILLYSFSEYNVKENYEAEDVIYYTKAFIETVNIHKLFKWWFNEILCIKFSNSKIHFWLEWLINMIKFIIKRHLQKVSNIDECEIKH